MKCPEIILIKSRMLVVLSLLIVGLSAGNSKSSDENTVKIAVNTQPFANAGSNRSVINEVFVSLTGGSSSDVDGDTLSYSWQHAKLNECTILYT